MKMAEASGIKKDETYKWRPLQLEVLRLRPSRWEDAFSNSKQADDSGA